MVSKFKRIISSVLSAAIIFSSLNISLTPAEAAGTVNDIIAAGDISLTNDSGYAWTNADFNGMAVAKPGNSGVSSSSSTIKFSATGKGVMSFGCYTSTEKKL